MISDGVELAAVFYRLTLFITGANVRSLRAVNNIRSFCEREFPGEYELEVVDLYSHPERAKANQIVAAPTLMRHNPTPTRYVIGDLSDFNALRKAVMVQQ